MERNVALRVAMRAARTGRTLCKAGAVAALIGTIPSAPSLAISASNETTIERGSSTLHEWPVFLELHLHRWANPSNRELLRRGWVVLQHRGEVDVSNFQWSQPGAFERTVRMQLEDLRFLLPTIASNRAEDRRTARRWVVGWVVADTTGRRHRAWDAPVTAANRALVLVYYLKREERRSPRDPELERMLLGAVREHQEYLADDRHFERSSNRGVIDALGLLETTRVLGDDGKRDLALSRLLDLLERLVSERGITREHAVQYHFVVQRWVKEIGEYLERWPEIDAGVRSRLHEHEVRMRRGAYFLQDHAGELPQIGDSDSANAATFSRDFRERTPPRGETALYDAASGFAVYKGSSRDRRYVVFRHPTGLIDFPFHIHDDALSVFVSYDGEVLLGDQGRFTYTWGNEDRGYFTSVAACNTVCPCELLVQHGSRGVNPTQILWPAKHTRNLSTADTVRWSASARHVFANVTRTVIVPKRSKSVVVCDTIQVQAAGDRPVICTIWNLGRDVRGLTAVDGATSNASSWVVVTRRRRTYRMSLEVLGESAPGKPPSVRVARGEREPHLGWYSPVFGVKRPAPAIVLTVHPVGTMVIRTRLEP